MAAKRSNPIRPSTEPAVRSFGEARPCRSSGCTTKLSRYNPDEFCSIHRDQIPAQPIVRRARSG